MEMSDFSKKSNELTYMLRGGRLYDISSRLNIPLSVDDVMSGGERFNLLLDDSLFFYVLVGKLTVKRKKVRVVISNYLASMFPMDLFSGFLIQEYKGVYTALVFKKDFNAFVNENIEFLSRAKKISTAYCELACRYQTFLFNDGIRVYEKKDENLDVLSDIPEGTLSAEDVFQDIVQLKTEIAIPGIKKSKDGGGFKALRNYQLAGAFILLCYVLFLAAGIMDIKKERKLERGYNEIAARYYERAGVKDAADPFAALKQKADRKVLAPFSIMNAFYRLGSAIPADVNIESLSLNERIIRIEGFTKDFTQMEALKTSMETNLKKTINIEESRQVGNQVKFVIRYEVSQ